MKNVSILTDNLKKALANYYNISRYVISVPRTKDGVDSRIVAYADKSSYISEQYKVLRTNLTSLSPDKPYKTFILTSAQPQEGKSITSANLAVTLSLDKEKKTILLDADMRRPSIHALLGIKKDPGLADILSGDAGIEDFLKKPMLGDLYVVPAGSTNKDTSTILRSTKIAELINRLKKTFDYIIFDTPPVLNVTDSSILGSMCDAVLFVVKAGGTQQASIEEAFNMLEGAQAKPKACILTNVHLLLDTYSYYTKYLYKYYKYQASDTENKPKIAPPKA